MENILSHAMKTNKTPVQRLKEHLHGLSSKEVIEILRKLAFDIRFDHTGQIIYEEEYIGEWGLSGIIEEELDNLTEDEVLNTLDLLKC